MNLRDKIVVMGDVHGDMGRVNKFVSRKHPAIILQTGDMGYWPRARRHRHSRVPELKIPEGTKLYWCDGNHEDHQELVKRDTDEFWPRSYYMDRGKTLTLPDGRVVLFMGGALSIDRHLRIPECGDYGYFMREQVRECDVMDLDIDRVDVVISHTCPKEFDVPMRYEYNDSSRLALSYILHEHRPKQWFCGHWHHFCKGKYLDCEWTAMGRFDAPGHGGWLELC